MVFGGTVEVAPSLVIDSDVAPRVADSASPDVSVSGVELGV